MLAICGVAEWAVNGNAEEVGIESLEFGKDFHEHEYLQNGKPQSAKLLMKRGDDGQDEFYAHIAFEFTPEPMKTETILGIDRGTLARRRRRTQAPDADLGYEEFLDKL